MPEPTAVERLVRRLIETHGPISLATLMRLANTGAAEGYYQTQQPFGADGDFVTAPDISQMFGELLGLALAQHWQMSGQPESVQVVELGPGRGVMMADVLRIWQRVAPDLFAAAHVTLIEASERLVEAQQRRLAEVCLPQGLGQNTAKANRAAIAARERVLRRPANAAVRAHNRWLARKAGELGCGTGISRCAGPGGPNSGLTSRRCVRA